MYRKFIITEIYDDNRRHFAHVGKFGKFNKKENKSLFLSVLTVCAVRLCSFPFKTEYSVCSHVTPPIQSEAADSQYDPAAARRRSSRS